MVAQMNSSADMVEKLNEELIRAQRDAKVDALTGLGNRTRFDYEMNRLVSAQKPFGLIMMDIDHFKAINDKHGHLIGDRVLRQLGKIMSTRTRATDIVTRYGGEEFAILLPGTEFQHTQLVAEKLRSSVQKIYMRRTDTGKHIGRITASFGVAEYAPDETATDLIERADKALFKAKTGGRNRIELAVSGGDS